jgi:hypothetical protein
LIDGPGPLGKCPEWYRVIQNAEAFGQHPADLVGLPETKQCAIWGNWREVANACKYEAREVLAERQKGIGRGNQFMGNG